MTRQSAGFSSVAAGFVLAKIHKKLCKNSLLFAENHV